MGKAWVFGDDISTDELAPGPYLKLPADELARHCLEPVAPDFARTIRAGDVVVAGNNFGQGSSREQAAVSLKLLGASAVLARSFGRIFYRNAINIGLPILVLPPDCAIAQGDDVKVDPAAGRIVNRTTGSEFDVEPIPDHLMAMLKAGGLIAQLESRIANGELARSR